MLIIGGSGSGKTNALLDLIKKQDSDSLIEKIYLYNKDLNERIYQFFIKKCGNVEIKHLNDLKATTEHSNTMNDVYNNIDDYDQLRKIRILIVFDDMIADIMTSKKFPAIIKELFIKCRKFNISLAFIPLSYFLLQKKPDQMLHIT